jgi:hypothetical protein
MGIPGDRIRVLYQLSDPPQNKAHQNNTDQIEKIINTKGL